LLVLTLASFGAVTTEVLPVGLLPAIADSFGTSEATTGLLVSAYAAMVMLLAVPLTAAMHRVPARRLLLWTMAGYALSNLLCAVAPTFEVLALARTVGGLSHAVFFSICIGYAARLVPPSRTGRALALVSAGITVALVFGSPLTTAIGNAMGWRMAFATLVVLMLATAVLIMLVLPAISTGTASPGGVTGRRRDAAAVIGSDALAYVGYFTLYTYVTVLLGYAGAGPAAFAPLLLLFGVSGLLGTWRAAPLLDRRPGQAAVTILAVISLSMIALGFAAPWLPLVVIVAVVWNTALGPLPSMFQSLTVRTNAITPELAGAWINTASNFGITFGSLLGGLILTRFDVPALGWLGAVPVLLALAVAILRPRAFPRSTEGDDRPLSTA
jgi:predicted MFS family arabinose efflux permease